MAYWHVVWLCMLSSAVRAQVQPCGTQQVHDLRLLMASHACTDDQTAHEGLHQGCICFLQYMLQCRPCHAATHRPLQQQLHTNILKPASGTFNSLVSRSCVLSRFVVLEKLESKIILRRTKGMTGCYRHVAHPWLMQAAHLVSQVSQNP